MDPQPDSPGSVHSLLSLLKNLGQGISALISFANSKYEVRAAALASAR